MAPGKDDAEPPPPALFVGDARELPPADLAALAGGTFQLTGEDVAAPPWWPLVESAFFGDAREEKGRREEEEEEEEEATGTPEEEEEGRSAAGPPDEEVALGCRPLPPQMYSMERSLIRLTEPAGPATHEGHCQFFALALSVSVPDGGTGATLSESLGFSDSGGLTQ